MHTLSDSWPKRARKKMRELGLTHSHLANLLGCTRGAIGHYLHGRRNPSFAQLELLAKQLKTKPGWLLFGERVNYIEESRLHYSAKLEPIMIWGNTQTGKTDKAQGQLDLYSAVGDDYGLTVISSEWSPRIKEGEVAIIRADQAPNPGDEIIAKYLGAIRFFIFIEQLSEQIIVSEITGQNKRYTLNKKEIIYLHVVTAFLNRRYIKQT